MDTMEAEILDGPSKWDLLVALGDGKVVELMLKFDDTLRAERRRVKISSVQAEDGSRESWNLKGYIPSQGRQFEAYYSSRRRKGHLRMDHYI